MTMNRLFLGLLSGATAAVIMASCHAPARCGVGTTLCYDAQGDTDDICYNPSSDEANCGACGHACPEANACVGGVCEPICIGGPTRCGHECVDLVTNDKHCGDC